MYLSLRVACRPSPLDGRRGIVRLHPQALAALGARPWDVLWLRGGRTTGVLAALSGPEEAPGVLVGDDLVLANAGLTDGGTVEVARAGEAAADSVALTGPPGVAQVISPDILRFALLGKVVMAGDEVSLLPQDLSPMLPGVDPAVLRGTSGAFNERLGYGWEKILLSVVGVEPADRPAIVGMATRVGWEGTGASVDNTVPSQDIKGVLPGLETQAASLREWLDVGFNRRSLLHQLGGVPQMGVLLTGPAGSGKAELVKAVAGDLGARIVEAWAPHLAALQPDAAAKALGELVAEARRSPPSILLLDDIEVLLPEGGGPLTSTLLEAITQLVAEGRTAVICDTGAPEKLDRLLRQPGRLDHELAFPLPSRTDRLEILRVLSRPMPLAPDVQLADVAARTPGFVAADLVSLCQEAALRAAHRVSSSAPGGPPTPGAVPAPPPGYADDATPTVERQDFDGALQSVRPTTVADHAVEPTGVTLEDVGDLAEPKRILEEAVLWPLAYPDTFKRLGVDPPHGVLMYGPPGCGKTFLLSAYASVGQVNLLAVKGAELLSKWVGESEHAVRDLFARARQSSPAIIFFDELDAIAPVRGQSMDSGATDRVVAALLTELDGVTQLRDIVVVGATNRPDLIDPALLRPGRLEELVYVPPPDAPARIEILKAAARHTPLETDIDLGALATACEGYSAADLAALVRAAAMCAMRRSLNAPLVTAADVDEARRTIHSSLDAQQIAALAAFSSRH